MKRIDAYFAPKKDIPPRAYLTVSALVAFLVFGFWCLMSYGGLVRSDFLPTPAAVVQAAIDGLGDGTLVRDTGVSVGEIMSGFILASIFAVPLGILMGSFKIAEAALEPITNFVRYLPVSALIRNAPGIEQPLEVGERDPLLAHGPFAQGAQDEQGAFDRWHASLSRRGARACADFAVAPSTRWSLATENGVS